MLDYLLQYGLFLAEVTTVVIAIGVVIGFLYNAIRHAREYTAEHLEVKNLNRRFQQIAERRALAGPDVTLAIPIHPRVPVNAEVKAGQRAGAKPGQCAAWASSTSATAAPAEMAGVS